MKKYLPYIAGILWLVALLQFTFSSVADRETSSQEENQIGAAAVQAASGEEGLAESACIVSFNGILLKPLETEEEQKKLLTELACSLGMLVTEEEIIVTESAGGEIVSLERQAAGGDVRIRILLGEYVTMELTMEGDLDLGLAYRERLAEAASAQSVNGTAYVTFEGIYTRKLSYEEKCSIQEELFSELSVTPMGGTTERYLFCKYGYTGELGDYVLNNGLKTNLNMAFADLSEEDATCIYIGIPYLRENF